MPQIPSKNKPPKQGFYIFDTHPIAYRSPVFRKLSQIHPQLKVFYFNAHFEGKRWWFHEKAKAHSHPTGLSLTKGFDSEDMQSSQTGLFGFYRHVKHIFRTSPPEAITIYGYFLPEHWVLWWLAFRLKIPLLFIGEAFSKESKGIRGWIKKWVIPLFFKQVKQFISIGKKNHAYYQNHSIHSQRVTRARYCVDVSFFDLPKRDSKILHNKVRRDLGIPDDAFVMLFVGRIFERKRPWDMVTLHKKLAGHHGLHTIMVGSGDQKDWIHKMVEDDSNFHLVGQKNQIGTREFYHAADLLILPSEYETWGLVVNEAFASGLPALVTEDCGVAMDLVESGKTGYVYPTAKIEVASVIVKWLIENPEKRLELAHNAHQRVLNQYNVEQFSRAMLGAFEAATMEGSA